MEDRTLWRLWCRPYIILCGPGVCHTRTTIYVGRADYGTLARSSIGRLFIPTLCELPLGPSAVHGYQKGLSVKPTELTIMSALLISASSKCLDDRSGSESRWCKSAHKAFGILDARGKNSIRGSGPDLSCESRNRTLNILPLLVRLPQSGNATSGSSEGIYVSPACGS